MRTFRILIADDHAIVRRGIRDVLCDLSEPAEVGEVGDGPSVLEALEHGQWDMVVLDISMPRMTGLCVLQEIKRRFPALPVLMLSAHAAALYVRESLKRGAAGYLSKESAPDELLAAVEAARAGHTYVTRALRSTVDVGA